MTSFMMCMLDQWDEMGGACSTYRRWKTRIKCWSKNLTGRDRSKELGIDGEIILEWTLRGGVDWTVVVHEVR